MLEKWGGAILGHTGGGLIGAGVGSLVGGRNKELATRVGSSIGGILGTAGARYLTTSDRESKKERLKKAGLAGLVGVGTEAIGHAATGQGRRSGGSIGLGALIGGSGAVGILAKDDKLNNRDLAKLKPKLTRILKYKYPKKSNNEIQNMINNLSYSQAESISQE